MKNRSRMDIVSAILEIAQGGAIKTKIMYSAFVSFPQLKEYLELLMERGMLEYTGEEKLYRTTENGRRFLKSYKEVGQTLYPKESRIVKTSG
jgi:predicted transcriptional regulator